MGEIETSGPDAEAFLQRILSNDVSKIAPGGAQYSRAVPRGRRRPRRPLHLPLRPDRYLTVTNAANHDKDLAWFQQQAGEFDVDVDDSAERLRDARRPGPAGARDRPGDRRRAAAGAHDRRAAHARRPHGARLRHRLHRRGRRRAPAATPATRRRSGTSSSAAAPRRPASPRATRCASRSASTSTATT